MREVKQPTPEEFKRYRLNVGTQSFAAQIMGAGLRTIQNWEAPVGSKSHRKMEAIKFETFLRRTKQLKKYYEENGDE
jgi:hypothetical protein